MYRKVENLYLIGYRYQQIFVIHYQYQNIG